MECSGHEKAWHSKGTLSSERTVGRAGVGAEKGLGGERERGELQHLHRMLSSHFPDWTTLWASGSEWSGRASPEGDELPGATQESRARPRVLSRLERMG